MESIFCCQLLDWLSPLGANDVSCVITQKTVGSLQLIAMNWKFLRIAKRNTFCYTDGNVLNKFERWPYPGCEPGWCLANDECLSVLPFLALRALTVLCLYMSKRVWAFGPTHQGNRPRQTEFACQSCGHRGHRDHNAVASMAKRGARWVLSRTCMQKKSKKWGKQKG